VTCVADPSDPTGRRCGACPSGYAGDSTTKNGCKDVDECDDGNNGGCFALSTCVNTAGGRTCAGCPAGYAGNGRSCADVDECADGYNGGCDALTRCVNQPGASACSVGLCKLESS
jgi:hypothetical protein